MKKFMYFLLSVAVTAMLTVPLYAQDGTRIGLGVSLTASGGSVDLFETVLSPASIYVPITFGKFRIEPEFGIFRVSSESGGDFPRSSTSTVLQFGTGLFAVNRIDKTLLYYGARFGLTRMSDSFDSNGSSDSSSRTNIYGGPALGAEYMFSEHFSLGGEAQLIYLSVGSTDDNDDTGSVLRSRALFFSRWHF